MLLKNRNYSNKIFSREDRSSAFTIVELLIVIVIIGILAAITIVSYTGIAARANQTTIISDLATAKKQFELYKADHGVYPTSLEDGTNCLKGTTLPNPDARYCLKSSGGSAYILEDATGGDYTLKLTKGTIAYKITKDLAPTSTTAVVAAASFVKTWGGAGADIGYGLIQTSDGGYAIAGYTSSFGAGSYDMYLAKYDASGSLAWNKIWGGANGDYGIRLIQTNDGGYTVTGYTVSYGAGSNDMFLVKYDASGNLIWNRTWGGANTDSGFSVTQSNDNGYIVTGYTTSYGSGSNDMFLVKYDTNGNLIWNKLWGGAGSDVGQSVYRTNDGGCVVTGYTISSGAGNNDMFIAKYDVSGNLNWNKTWGSANSEIGQSIIQTSDGGYIVSGDTFSFGAGGDDMFIVKYDSAGNISWNKTWGGGNTDAGFSVVQVGDGGYVVTGSTISYGAGSDDVTLVKFDTNGNFIWNKLWGGAGSDTGQGIVQTSDGGVLVAGYTPSYGAGGSDTVIVKTNPSGIINNCLSPMCQTITATITNPSATITTPSVTVTTPSVIITTPTATVSSPTATVTTVVAP